MATLHPTKIRRGPLPSWQIALYLTGGAVIFAGLGLLIGIGIRPSQRQPVQSQPTSEAPTTSSKQPAKAKIYEREEFKKLVMNKSRRELSQLLGHPDEDHSEPIREHYGTERIQDTLARIQESALRSDYWVYFHRTKAQKGKLDRDVVVTFEAGLVIIVEFHP
jgi:hypothetical protein